MIDEGARAADCLATSCFKRDAQRGPPALYRGKTMEQEREDEEKELQYVVWEGFRSRGDKRHGPSLPARVPEGHVMSQVLTR